MDPTSPQRADADAAADLKGAPVAGLVLREGEPAAGPWREVAVDSLLALLQRSEVPAGRPRVVAVDGRAGSGKSTLVAALARAAPASAVVDTDDVAWHHSFFDWSDLLIDSVLLPAREGRAVRYRPPAWDQRARAGAIEVPAATRWLFVEGTGAARREMDGLLDAVVWVQSDYEQAERAGIARDVGRGADGDLEQATAFWHRWLAEEVPFMDDHRPWERADAVVAGVGLPPAGEGRVLIAPTVGGDTSHRLWTSEQKRASTPIVALPARVSGPWRGGRLGCTPPDEVTLTVRTIRASPAHDLAQLLPGPLGRASGRLPHGRPVRGRRQPPQPRPP